MRCIEIPFVSEIHYKIILSKILMHESESHPVMSDSLQLHGLYSPCNSPGQNTGEGSLSLLQGIFPTQGLNPDLSYCRQIPHQLSHRGSLYSAWNRVNNGCCAVLSRLRLFGTPWTISRQAPLPREFSRQEYLSRLPFPTLGDLLVPGIETASLASPALAGGFLYHWATWEAQITDS